MDTLDEVISESERKLGILKEMVEKYNFPELTAFYNYRSKDFETFLFLTRNFLKNEKIQLISKKLREGNEHQKFYAGICKNNTYFEITKKLASKLTLGQQSLFSEEIEKIGQYNYPEYDIYQQIVTQVDK